MSDDDPTSFELKLYPPPPLPCRAPTCPAWPPTTTLCAEAEADYEGYWARLAREFVRLEDAVHQGARREQGAVLQVVRGRHAERLVQLPGPPGRAPAWATRSRSSSRPTTARSRSVTYSELLARTCRAGQRAEGARRQEGRPGRHLHVDVGRGRGRDAGLRAHRRHAFGGVRRLLGAEPARPHRGRRRGDGDHRRRAAARRQAAAAEGHRRRGARAGRLRAHQERDRLPAHRRQGRLERARATSGCTR